MHLLLRLGACCLALSVLAAPQPSISSQVPAPPWYCLFALHGKCGKDTLLLTAATSCESTCEKPTTVKLCAASLHAEVLVHMLVQEMSKHLMHQHVTRCFACREAASKLRSSWV
jgi:hypothetical protein